MHKLFLYIFTSLITRTAKTELNGSL